MENNKITKKISINSLSVLNFNIAIHNDSLETRECNAMRENAIIMVKHYNCEIKFTRIYLHEHIRQIKRNGNIPVTRSSYIQ